MAINKLFQVILDIPKEIYQEFGETQKFEQEWLEATKGAINAEINEYSDVFIIAQFSTRLEAKNCEKKLLEMVERFKAVIQD
jgi:hypothetical protein